MEEKGKVFKVLTCEFAHETNTFCKIPTTIDCFRRQCYITEEQEILRQRRGTRSSLGATYEVGEKYGWQVTTSISATSNPTGRLTNETFETIVELLVAPLQSQSFDGLLLHLHGAMVTDQFEDAEGELLTRIRTMIGGGIPIIVTLDLHGNITETMARASSCLIACRTYPHIDFYEQAWRGGELLQKSMLGKCSLRTVIAKRPLLRGLDGGRTHEGSPLRTLIVRGEAFENDETDPIQVVSICAGFTAADIYEIGPSVTVTVDVLDPSKVANGCSSPSSSSSSSSSPSSEADIIAHANKIAKEFMDFAWDQRFYSSVSHVSIQDAADKAKREEQEGTYKAPLVIADVTDNPGSGHYGDATNLLRQLVDIGLTNALFYAIYDPDAVQQGQRIGVGNRGTIALGGKHDPQAGGAPLDLDGLVVSLTDGHFPSFGIMGGGVWQNMGLSMLFRVGQGVDICVISNNGQALDLAQVTSLGSDPTHKSTIALKSNHHFRAAFGPISREIITVDGGGLGSVIGSWAQNVPTGTYKNVRRPIWPIDQI